MIDVIVEELRVCGRILFPGCDLVEGRALADLVKHGAIKHIHFRNPERIPQLSPEECPAVARAAVKRLRRNAWLIMRRSAWKNDRQIVSPRRIRGRLIRYDVLVQEVINGRESADTGVPAPANAFVTNRRAEGDTERYTATVRKRRLERSSSILTAGRTGRRSTG